uniref:Enoyl-CoA hydratase/isomerase family protein n=1 Tax=Odontella aurita TaxID=265563 RepID=A0A7S4HRZ7_9STRA|eukprot:CAMPEP_0113545226 /NCGR_PEP_ID=MMETSP0015_2-20120614/11144_1 /TAXON_ID=2838 /ORGANISM="Odontella" /LENGTH=246 /DNA_ID=CAMNT_0000445569 /DNA_START=39 /DNA_END=779 /DNA_ORIENTATION=+ /assembly_acc=CAM_ASM_000160
MTGRTIMEDNGVTLAADPSGIFTLLIDRGPNVANPSLVKSLSNAVEKVEAASHPKALIIRGVGKFFSNGLDLDWMMANPTGTGAMIESFWRILARILILDCRTVAAINGHAFGAGLFLALACDFRVMRTERGYLCWPELNLGMRLAKGFAELSKAKASQATLREGVLTGKRYGSLDALQAGLIDAECPMESLAERAEDLAAAGLPDALGLANFDPRSFRDMKVELYCDAYRALAMGATDSEPHSRI